MYAVNPISRFTLITPDECTKKLPNASLDSVRWISAIELAEERFVLPVLGWNLYSDICSQKNVAVTSGNIAALQPYLTAEFGTDVVTGQPNVLLLVGQTVNAIDLVTVTPAYLNLWNQALWNFVFNCVWFVALTDNYAQFTSSGVQKVNPLDSSIGTTSAANVGISLYDLRYLNDNLLLSRISPLQTYLEQWLCINNAQYPLYPAARCRDKFDHRTGHTARVTGFINIYDDDDRWGRCGDRWNSSMPIPTPTPAPVTSTCSIVLSIVTNPDGTLYGLCNLQTIPAQYAPSTTTLILSNLVGKYVNATGALYNGNPVIIGATNTGGSIGYNSATGTFDRTLQGGFNDGDTFVFLYTETM